MKQELLMEGQFYHIYNRGNNGCALFVEPECFRHFLDLYEIYIQPVAESFAWVLMGNHFHFLVRIKKNIVYKYGLENIAGSDDENLKKWQTIEASSEKAPANKVKPVPWRHFGHLFNAYSRYHQIRFGRTGNLFERPFKRKLIHDEHHFRQVLLYIHQNPVHHGLCQHPLEYPWSSYLNFISENQSLLQREATKRLFGNNENYEKAHRNLTDKEHLDDWLELDVEERVINN